MRALTVQQPWAWAIVHGGKDVENRTRNLAGSYRGPVAIHAGMQVSQDGVDHELLAPEWARGRCYVSVDGRRATLSYPTEAGVYGPNRLASVMPLGAFVGVVDLWAVHQAQPGCCPNRGSRPFGSPWAEPGVWHLCVTDPRPLVEPVLAKGRLGLWTPTSEQTVAIVERIGHAA